jgi:glycosyltransferase involved in cell wall biosynthesis
MRAILEAPCVSIVLPTYNGSRWLAESIESCLRQTYPNWELILVDDASTDSTPEIIARYAEQDARIRTVRNPANRRLPGSLNAGFALARGKLLTWTSDDNEYRPNALAVMAAYLEEHPEADIVYSDFSMVDEEGRVLERWEARPKEVLVGFWGCGACFLYRRAVMERVGDYAEDLFLAEDYDFWLRASISCSLHPLNEDLYLYRYHGASLTETYAGRVRQVAEQTLERNLPKLSWLTTVLRAEAHVNLANGALGRGDLRAVRRHIRAALRCSPGTVMRKGKRALGAALFGTGFAHLLEGRKRSAQGPETPDGGAR